MSSNHRVGRGVAGVLVAAGLLAAVVACGGSGGGDSGGGDDPAPLPLVIEGQSVMKVRSVGAAWVALAETSRSLELPTRPERRLLLSHPDGRPGGAPYLPPDGWSLLDFALHPSGQTTVLLGNDRELRLMRLSSSGQLLHDQPHTDELVPTDPFYGEPSSARDHQSLLPHVTRDAARLAPLGEDVILAFRSGRHAVLLKRLAYATVGGFAQQWRSLVEPGVFVGARFLTGGSFDPFKSLDHQWRVVLDADAQGHIAVAVSLDYADHAFGHAEHFGDTMREEFFTGALLTQFNADGERLGTAVIDTVQRSELQALRWVGGQVAVAGRVRREQATDGWDAYLALVPAGRTTLAAYRVLDFDAGDVIFDVAALPDGGLLVAGSTGYTQNPAGASISEYAQPLLARLPADGAQAQRVPWPAGPRHNQLRTITPRGDGAWLLGGMENGPGTHSADANPALLRTDGYVRELRP